MEDLIDYYFRELDARLNQKSAKAPVSVPEIPAVTPGNISRLASGAKTVGKAVKGVGTMGLSMVLEDGLDRAGTKFIPRASDDTYWGQVGNRLRDYGQSVATGAAAGSVVPGLGTAGGAVWNAGLSLISPALELVDAGKQYLDLRSQSAETADIAKRLQQTIKNKQYLAKFDKATPYLIGGLGALGLYNVWKRKREREDTKVSLTEN